MMKVALISVSLMTFSSFLSAEVESELPIGIEAVTGIRSEYIHRGFQLSQRTFDFQLEGEVTLSENLYLGYGAWYATETSRGNFSETGAKLSLLKDMENYQWFSSVSYRELSNSVFDSGVEVTTGLDYLFSDKAMGEMNTLSQKVGLLASYDSGADGWYAAFEYNAYQTFGENAYVSFKAGVSATSDYYNRDGLNDFYSRVSYTYNLTKQVSLTPFAGASLQLDDKNGKDFLYGGVWFEVSF